MRNKILTIGLVSLFLFSIVNVNAQRNMEDVRIDGRYNSVQTSSNQQQKTIAIKSVDDYCIPTGVNCTEGDGLTSFILESISNTNSGCSEDGYGDFLSLSTDLRKGSDYTIEFEVGYSNQMVSAWIDYNQNDTFESEESIIIDYSAGNPGETYFIDFSIPSVVPIGATRLRIRSNYNASSSDPCEIWSYGETEDYGVTILEAYENDVAVDVIDMNAGYNPGIVIPIATFKNNGLAAQSFPVTMEIGAYSSTKQVSDLGPNESIQVSFDDWNATNGNYEITACTDLSGDENPANNCLDQDIVIAGSDVAVVSINIPSSPDQGELIPKVNIKNNSFSTETFDVQLTIGEYTETQTVANLEYDETRLISFSPWEATTGSYTAEACTLLEGDENSSNDCLSKTITVNQGIVNFRAHETVCLVNLSLPYKDISTFEATAWNWTFEGGNPSTSTEEKPMINYPTVGTFDVTLTISTSEGEQTITKQDYITVAETPLAEWELIEALGIWISDIEFTDANNGFVVGEDGKVFQTNDSGNSWFENDLSGFAAWAYQVKFIDDQEGYVNGYQAVLMKTIDGGINWEHITPDVPAAARLFQMDAWDSDHITQGGQKTGSSSLDANTTQVGPGGFTAYETPGGSQYNSIKYLSQDTIVMQHFMDLTFSYDGGLTFSNKSNTELFGFFRNIGYNTMDFGTNKVGFMGGTVYDTEYGIIAKTTNGGQTWVELREGFDEIRGVNFIDESIGFMVGHNGFIYKTIDGGDNWYGTNLPTVDIEAVYIVDENLVFIASRNGDIFKSKNGFLQQPYFTDLSVDALDMPNIVSLVDNPFTITSAITNNGQNEISSFELNYQINGEEIFTETINNFSSEFLNGITFIIDHPTEWYPLDPGDYEIKVWVDNPNGDQDQNVSNDTITRTINVIQNKMNNRIILIEEATGTWCGYCPHGEWEVSMALTALNQDETRAIAVAIHGSDQFEINETEPILSAFSGGGYPSAWIDRYKFFDEQAVSIPQGTWLERAQQRLIQDSPINITLEVVYDEDAQKLAITQEVNCVINAEGNFNYNLYIIENGLLADQSNYFNEVSGSPYEGLGNPIPNHEQKHVVRDMTFDSWGHSFDLPNNLIAGETYSVTHYYEIPNGMVPENLDIIGFITNHNNSLNDRNVVNAQIAHYEDFTMDVTTNNIKLGNINVNPNPTRGITYLEFEITEYFEFEYEIFTINGGLIKQSKANWNGTPIALDTSDLEDGVYLIQVKAQGKIHNIRLIKQ